MKDWLSNAVKETLRVEIQTGDITTVRQAISGWRVLPSMVVACINPGQVTVTIEGGAAHSVSSGEALVIPASVVHKIVHVLPRCVSRWIHVNFFIFGRFDLFRIIETPVVVNRARGLAIGAAIEKWVRRRERQQAQNPLAACIKEMELGFQVLSILSEVVKPQSNAHARMEQLQSLGAVIDHIGAHYPTPIYRDTLTHLAGMSTAKFHRVFREATGETPMDYLMNVRLRHAQQSLIATNKSIAEIAREVGYPDYFAFSKRFKQSCGMSPLAYRKTAFHFMTAP